MTPQEKLENIRNYFKDPHTPFSILVEQFPWLISRVEELEEFVRSVELSEYTRESEMLLARKLRIGDGK